MICKMVVELVTIAQTYGYNLNDKSKAMIRPDLGSWEYSMVHVNSTSTIMNSLSIYCGSSWPTNKSLRTQTPYGLGLYNSCWTGCE